MRAVIGVVVTGFICFGLSAADKPDAPLDPEAIEAKLREVRAKLEKLRAEERELAERLASAKASAPGSIKAEVTGVLRHPGNIVHYYVSVWSDGVETRVWLPPVTDKVRDQLGTLHGKAVVVTGRMNLPQPKRVPAVSPEWEMPEGAVFMWPFEIAVAPDREPKK
jgi:hypothetical protein